MHEGGSTSGTYVIRVHVKEFSSFSISGHPKYENWMSELPKEFLKTSLTEIAIPGSHDSASYSLNKTEELAPEVPNEVTHL